MDNATTAPLKAKHERFGFECLVLSALLHPSPFRLPLFTKRGQYLSSSHPAVFSRVIRDLYGPLEDKVKRLVTLEN